MGRPRTINISRQQLLAGVQREFNREQERLERLAATATNTWPDAQLADLRDVGVAVSVDRFLGALTDSERIRAQQELRRCEAAGLVQIYGGSRAQRVKLTEAGEAWLAERATKSEAASDG